MEAYGPVARGMGVLCQRLLRTRPHLGPAQQRHQLCRSDIRAAACGGSACATTKVGTQYSASSCPCPVACICKQTCPPHAPTCLPRPQLRALREQNYLLRLRRAVIALVARVLAEIAAHRRAFGADDAREASQLEALRREAGGAESEWGDALAVIQDVLPHLAPGRSLLGLERWVMGAATGLVDSSAPRIARRRRRRALFASDWVARGGRRSQGHGERRSHPARRLVFSQAPPARAHATAPSISRAEVDAVAAMDYSAAAAASADIALEGRRLLGRIGALTEPPSPPPSGPPLPPRPYFVRPRPARLPHALPPPRALTAEEAAEVEAAREGVAEAGRQLVCLNCLLLIWNPSVYFQISSRQTGSGADCVGDADAPFQASPRLWGP
jgi:hypothetical protein